VSHAYFYGWHQQWHSALCPGSEAHGWQNGQPCVTDLYATGNVPHIDISQTNGLNMTLALALDIKCKKHENSTQFDQVFTIVTKEIKFTGSVSAFIFHIQYLIFIFKIDKNYSWIHRSN
jgi:hypothetical protein